MDLFTINGRTTLSIVDRDTRFTVCRFMQSNQEVKAKDVWRMLLQAWVFSYSGYPDILRHDRGTQFVAAELQVVAAEAGISAATVGVESANAMGIGERVHGPIRRIFEKLLADNPDFDDEDFLLAAATKSYNDMQGVDGLVPTLLVFGVYPKIPLPGSANHAVPNHVRLRVIKAAREEYQKIVDAQRLKDALVPDRPTPTLPVGLSHGTKVLVYRQTTGRWEPATFLYEAGSLVYLRVGTRNQPFSREKVKMAIFGHDHGDDDGRLNIFDVQTSVADNREHIADGDADSVTAADPAATEEPLAVPHDDDPFAHLREEPGPDIDPTISPTPELLPSLEFQDNGDAMVFYATPNVPSIDEIMAIHDECLATEVISHKDPRVGEFTAAIDLELSGLMEKGVFQEVRIPVEDRKSINVLKSRFVLALKNPGTPEEKHKARLVVQAMPHADRDRSHLFTYSPTVTKASFRILLTLAASHGFDVHLRDIKQAYVCSEFDLIHEAYIVPPKTLKLDPTILWRLRKPLYGLPESGLLWYETYRSYHEVDLKMTAAVVDPCLYHRVSEDKLEGMIVTQVDDSAICGNPGFLQEETRAAVQFPSAGRSPIDHRGSEFNGSRVSKLQNGGFSMDQSAYISRIDTERSKRDEQTFGTLKGKLHYASSNTRPDHACAINLLSQTLPKDAAEPQFKELDRVNAEMHATSLSLVYTPLDLDSIELCVYADASFANCPGFRSQLGYVVFLRDKHRNCSLISWSSARSKRVTRSVLAAELFALSHAYDIGFALRFTISELLCRPVTMHLYTDSKTLFQSVINLTSMTEKRLLIDIATLREAYRSGDLEHLAHIDTADNPADAMTNPRSTAALVRALQTNTLEHKVNMSVGTGAVPVRSSDSSGGGCRRNGTSRSA